MGDNVYKREVADDDGELLQFRVPRYGIQGKIRVMTGSWSCRPVWLTLQQAREAHEALGEAISAAGITADEPETVAPGKPAPPSGAAGDLHAGDFIRVRRYVVSSLGEDRGSLEPSSDWTGYVRVIIGKLIYLREAPGGFFCADDVFLGSDPATGISQWLVTGIQRLAGSRADADAEHELEGRVS